MPATGINNTAGTARPTGARALQKHYAIVYGIENCVRNHPPLTPPVKGGGLENPLPRREREGREGTSER